MQSNNVPGVEDGNAELGMYVTTICTIPSFDERAGPRDFGCKRHTVSSVLLLREYYDQPWSQQKSVLSSSFFLPSQTSCLNVRPHTSFVSTLFFHYYYYSQIQSTPPDSDTNTIHQRSHAVHVQFDADSLIVSPSNVPVYDSVYTTNIPHIGGSYFVGKQTRLFLTIKLQTHMQLVVARVPYPCQTAKNHAAC
jgi:hypothetical protein